MIGLYLAALAVVGCPLALLAYALLRGVSVRASLDVRPGDAPPPEPRPPRARTQTHAAPRARGGAPKIPPPPEDTWDGTTPTPETGVPAPQRRSGDS